MIVRQLSEITRAVEDLANFGIRQSLKLGDLMISLGRVEEALASYRAAEETLLKMLDDKEATTLASINFRIADAYSRLNDTARSKQQYEISYSMMAARYGTLSIISVWLKGYLDELCADFKIQGKAIGTDEVANVEGLLVVMLCAADELLKKNGLPCGEWVIVPSSMGLAEVVPVLKEERANFNTFMKLRSALADVVAVEFTTNTRDNAISIDHLYEKSFYSAAQRSELRFETSDFIPDQI